ncbi:Hypothetical protein CAP_5264 [Chondromyces apiculatus DSM 436]|uniref:AB hydrolase-1 domain-containing protein n=1 Tax=Chondromyces apiculatus DSM 436 TaxID=1192034 RepID=A0A017T350_9BACT|nr:Hypothetical protein CAP_5264 [Chondromyces apiculatus DSM 436]
MLVHGLTDSCRTWNLVAPALSAGRRVFAIDLPGHGRSSRPDASYDAAWYARVVAGWVDTLGLDEFDLVGHSLGGGIAMRLLLELPGRVQRLALLAAGGLGVEVALPLRLAAATGFLDLAAPLLMGVGTRAGMMVLGGNFNASERRHLARINAKPGTGRALARTLRSTVDLKGQLEHFLDHAHRLGQLPPLAIYWGERDPVIPARHAQEVTRYLEGVRVRRFASAGHYPHREAATELVPELLRFLEEPQPTPRIRPGTRAPRAALPERPRLAAAPFAAPLARKIAGLV